MASQDVYGPRYWSVTIYQARLLYFLPPEFETLRDVKDRAEASGSLSLKKVNWEKLHVLGLLEVDRTRHAWVYVRRGPLWERFWESIELMPEPGSERESEQLDQVDAAFDHSAQNSIRVPDTLERTA